MIAYRYIAYIPVAIYNFIHNLHLDVTLLGAVGYISAVRGGAFHYFSGGSAYFNYFNILKLLKTTWICALGVWKCNCIIHVFVGDKPRA